MTCPDRLQALLSCKDAKEVCKHVLQAENAEFEVRVELCSCVVVRDPIGK